MLCKTVEEHLKGATKELKDAFEQLNSSVLDISSEIERYTTASEILYKTSVNFIALAVQKKNNRLRLLLRTIEERINDPKKLTKKVPKQYGWGNITCIVNLEPKEIPDKYTWEDIMELVFQAYKTTQ